ncbi:hypothetical protein ACHAXT_007791 [Thalassiosira profunda]
MECVASARLGGTCGNGTAVEINGEEPYQIYTTGHSLGAADSVLLGAALHLTYPDETLMSINFGCPKIGNTERALRLGSGAVRLLARSARLPHQQTLRGIPH